MRGVFEKILKIFSEVAGRKGARSEVASRSERVRRERTDLAEAGSVLRRDHGFSSSMVLFKVWILDQI